MRTILRDNYTPEMGAYHETLVIDEARHKKYLFDCDGVFTDITNPLVVSERGDSEDYAASQKWVTDIDDKVDGLAEDLGDEIQARTDADDAIWAEIEEIEMSSDVVDIVGTYAELQQYDTTHLKDNDIIKVLSDETHQNETAYYRWSTATDTFSYVGSEGPYYTESEIDTMMAAKQDTLIAGTNIQIAADGKTISATDTTYSDFTGATAQQAGAHGLVPAPTTSDIEKFLKGDGTWGEVPTVTTFYTDTFEGSQVYLYKNEMETIKATFAEVADALGKGPVRIVSEDTGAGQVIYVREYWDDLPNGTLELLIDDNLLLSNKSVLLSVVNSAQPSADALFHVDIIPNYTLPTASSNTLGGIKVGSNLSISSGVLSAKDMVGATSMADGTAGYVPAPTSSDINKFLKGDGTWGEASSTLILYTSGLALMGNMSYTKQLYYDEAMTSGNTISYADFIEALEKGTRILIKDNTINAVPSEYYYEVIYYAIKTITISGQSVEAPFFILSYTPVNTDSTVITRLFRFDPYSSFSSLMADGKWFVTLDVIDRQLQANASTAGIAKLYTTTGQNTDGSVTQKLFTDTVGDIETALQILNSGAGVP